MPVWMRWMLVDSSGSRKPDGKADRDDILVPRLQAAGQARTAPAGDRRVASPSRLASRTLGDFLVADEVGRIDVTVADAVLERDAPLPSGLSRGRRGCRASAARRSRTAPPARGRTATIGSNPRSRSPSASPISSARMPEQSTNRSPPTSRPSARRTHFDVAALGILDRPRRSGLRRASPRALRFRCADSERPATHRTGKRNPCRRGASSGCARPGRRTGS